MRGRTLMSGNSRTQSTGNARYLSRWKRAKTRTPAIARRFESRLWSVQETLRTAAAVYCMLQPVIGLWARRRKQWWTTNRNILVKLKINLIKMLVKVKYWYWQYMYAYLLTIPHCVRLTCKNKNQLTYFFYFNIGGKGRKPLIHRVNWRHRIYGHDTLAILWV